ncbi:MAG: ImmA/IrrE family metallo-endopeptidase [Chloroflexota bacterium]
MPNYVRGLNPQMLKWARERAGYSLAEIARLLKRDVEVVSKWESGESAPTYVQLETLAYTYYKRPTALFFFPSPPEEPEAKQSFRTLPDSEVNRLQPDTLLAIREAKARQISLSELSGGVNPSKQLIYRELEIDVHHGVQSAAARVRQFLGISLPTQKSWKSTETALEKWRDAVQRAGIFVFKRSFKQKDVSGFCLSDPEFPVIYLNNSTAKSRQIFTLFHELAHILLNTNGVTKQNDNYINQLEGDARRVEVFCNQFAGEFLVPSVDFYRQVSSTPLMSNRDVISLVEELASQFNVSREVILRKLLDRELVSQTLYDKLTRQWLEEYRAQKERAKEKPGGNPNATHTTYLGTKYLELAFANYYQGKCTLEQLAGYLEVRAKRIPDLEQLFLSKVAAS